MERGGVCSHPEWVGYPGQERPAPVTVTLLCRCGATWVCPTCGFGGGGSSPHTCSAPAPSARTGDERP
jgi:hypothetical protein